MLTSMEPTDPPDRGHRLCVFAKSCFFEVAEAPQGAPTRRNGAFRYNQPFVFAKSCFFEVAEAPQGSCGLETELLGITNQRPNLGSIFWFSQNRLAWWAKCSHTLWQSFAPC